MKLNFDWINTNVRIDYDRTHFASPDVQKKYFREIAPRHSRALVWVLNLTLPPGLQLSLAKKHRLPLFLHSRAASEDFVAILRQEGFGEDGGSAIGGRGGVVHSFTGTKEEVKELVGTLIT